MLRFIKKILNKIFNKSDNRIPIIAKCPVCNSGIIEVATHFGGRNVFVDKCFFRAQHTIGR